ncbi:PH domain-containing protein, partial [Candidatus Gracilibacteria bacterium]|nr:PH domain-containing protein [Candidatus Gracilibacteria bacterium]
VLFELGGRIISGFLILVIFFLNDLVELQKDINEFQKYLWVLCLVGGIIALIAISIFIINYLDLKRRKYEVYTDSIFYTNGFLTKIYSFLPMEKVSDVENKQGFFSKMFGLHDIIVSSEGVDNQVVFSNMTEGETLIKNIKYLKDAITLTETEILEEKVEEKKVDEVVGFTDKTDFAGNYDRQFSATYSMYLPRVIVTSVFYGFCISVFVFFYIQNIGYILPIFGICTLVVLIKGILDVNFNTFIVDKNTVEHRYEFLTNNHKTFTIDKITGVEFKENIIDKIFKTCSVKFLSIGGNGYINFVSIKKTATFYDDILKKVGIDKKEDFEDVEVVFNLKNFILENILSIIVCAIISIFVLIIIIGISSFDKPENIEMLWIIYGIWIGIVLVLIPILGFIYGKIAYSKRFYNQRLHKNFYESEFGVIFQAKIYSLFKNIKSVEAVKYPFSSAGTIKLDVAGDVAIKDQKSQSISFAGIEIKAKFLENIYNLQNKIDSILGKRTVSEEILEKSGQSIWNSTFILIILFIAIIIGFIYLSIILSSELNSEEISGLKVIGVNVIISAFIILAIRIWYIKSKYYLLQKDRVLTGSGIINKSKKTILYDRINFVEKNQGLLGKIFGNGIVQIYTVGSGNVDMVLEDSKDFRKLYDNLKKD